MIRRLVVSAVVVLTVVGCSSAGGYHPKIDPAQFSATIDNPWFPLEAGSTRVSAGVKDGKRARDVFTVTHRTLVVDGVTARVVRDQLYLDGALEETTLDYYAQDRAGTVWYFGEDTRTLDATGKTTGTGGTWRAGRAGAQPGVYMPAHPALGRRFRQEFLPGAAEDHFEVVDLSASVTVPYVSSHRALLTKEWTPLEPNVLDHKYYVRGVGQVREISVKGPKEALDLVSSTRDQ